MITRDDKLVKIKYKVNWKRLSGFSSHSEELLEEDDDVDDEIDEAVSDGQASADDDAESDAENGAPKRPSYSYVSQRSFGKRPKGLSHEKLMLKEEVKFRSANYDLNFFER